MARIIRRLDLRRCRWQPLGFVARILTTLGAMDGLSLGTYDGTVIRYSESLTEVTVEGNIDGSLIGA